MHNDDEWALFLLFRPFVFDKDPDALWAQRRTRGLGNLCFSCTNEPQRGKGEKKRRGTRGKGDAINPSPSSSGRKDSFSNAPFKKATEIFLAEEQKVVVLLVFSFPQLFKGRVG